jgi:hypothetical protein
MTATTSLPRHGTYSRANGQPRDGRKPCKCGPCKAKRKSYSKTRRVLADTGRSLTVPAGPVAAHLRMLLAAGDNVQSIYRKTGYDYGQLANIIAGRQKRLRRSRAEQILALRPGEPITADVDAVGSMRRIQSLMAAKHSLRYIAAETGVSVTVLGAVVNGRQRRIERRTADSIAAEYERLSATPGTSIRSAHRAQRMGWAPPICWDGRNLDDPAAFPDWTGRCGTIEGFRRHIEQDIPACVPCEAAEAAQRNRKARCAA